MNTGALLKSSLSDTWKIPKKKKQKKKRKCRAGPPPSSLACCGETEISTFNSRLMCAARPGPLFFTLFPLLTWGGIINPTLKTACRDRARFRRDFRSLKIPTRLHFSLHIHFSLYFLSGFTVPPLPSFLHSHPVSSFSSFPLPSLCNLCTNVKLTVYSVLQPSSLPKIRDSLLYFTAF